ncbi:MAG: UDP-N-acetylglucosamine--N-acetylmuramyl-(pentapeptide) pyrophosphoryl-undecaprenol N-acetylglucosamine transferase [Patescibacteria group bacterium]|nr:UDP-N-acetylglucosamine--N-acetylmuramyl-(pentapeptide) pyrophosphoryl-undecaprenol N-acetylglucosamine transferase [Patescibacteria group bacterium]
MRVLFSGGGTLGSVTPLLAVSEALHEMNHGTEFLWIGTDAGPERESVERHSIEFRAVTSGRLRRFFTLNNLLTPFLVLKGMFEVLSILREWRPDVVVSAGGFVAVPVVWVAWMLRIPVHIHQMDWRPGLANKLAAPFARSVSVVFKKSKSDFPRKKVTVTGNPVRKEILFGHTEVARDKFRLDIGTPIVLVLGGGTGAMNLNRLVAEAASEICRKAQLMHLTGEGKHIELPAVLGQYRQYGYLGADMGHAFAVADLVITRAGMGTLTELAALGKPSIVVPIPDSHQEENARYFADKGAAMYFKESRGGADLAEEVRRLLGDSDKIMKMASAMGSINNVGAAKEVARIISGYMK